MGGGGRQKETPQIDIELDRAGGFGKYQLLTTTIMIIGMISGGFIIHGLAYMELEPSYYMCDINGVQTPCTPEEFCAENPTNFGPDVVSYDYPDHNTNLYNWYTKLELVCGEHPKQGMILIATSAMISTAISCLFIPRLGDLYGRWPVYVFALCLQLPIYIAAALFKRTLYMIIVCFFLGPVIIGRMACGFLLLLEMVPRRNQPMVGASIMVAEGACLIIWTFYFVVISKNAFWFLWFTIILNLVGLAGCAYITESPRYLYGMERFEECRKVLRKIALRNGVENYDDAVFPEESELMIESSDDPVERISKINNSGPIRTSEQFGHLLDGQPKEDAGEENSKRTDTRYMTSARKTQTITKRESVAFMHERVTGLGMRENSQLYLAGVDKTQGIALDELFGKKQVDVDGKVRQTKTFRKTRVSGAQTSTVAPQETSIKEMPGEEDEEIVVLPTQVTRGKGLCQGELAFTLLLMVVMWVGTCTNYFLINLYLKYIPGSEYINITIAGVAEIVAHLSAGKIFGKFGVKVSFIVGYGISLAGGVCLIWQNKFEDNVPLVAFFVLLAKFGASMNLCICQIATPWMFPTTVCGTAFGICNLFGRFMQAAAPFITELKIPLPMMIFSGFSLISLLCSLPLKSIQE